MIETTLQLCFGALTLAILCGLVRIARGPSVLDRILSFDLITTCAVGMIVLLSVQWSTSVYLELVLIFSLLGFMGTVAFVYYLNRSDPAPSDRRAPGRGSETGNPPGSV